MNAMADALSRAGCLVGRKAPAKPKAKCERCPIHNLPKPCPQCQSTFALAIAQRTSQRRQEQIKLHKKWSRERREKRERGTT